MQNIKPIEDYKKQLRSEKEQQDPEMDQEVQDLGEPEMDGEDMGDEEADDNFGVEAPAEVPAMPAPIETGEDEHKPYMVITNLKKLADQANQLVAMVQSSGKVEAWAVDHITTSSDDIEEVFNYYKYKD